jgi:Phage tail lysozyme
LADSDNRQFFYNKLTGELGLSPQAALGVLYSLGGESHANLDTTAVGAGGDFGVAQWTGSRKAGLNKMAETLGTNNTDPNTQWQYMKSELVGPYSHVLSGLRNASTAADATNIWTTQYEAPAVNNWQQRYAGGSAVGSLNADNEFVPGKGGSAPNPTPTGTTLNSTPVAANTTTPAPAPSAASQFASGNIGGGLQTMFKQGAPAQLGQALEKKPQQITPMQAPNIGVHQPNPQAAQLLASLIPQNQQAPPSGVHPGAPLGAMGMMPGLGMMGMGGMYPYGMMGMM